MKAFVIVALGGLGSMRGAIAAGIVLGVAENVVSGLLVPGYRDAVSFLLLLADPSAAAARVCSEAAILSTPGC